MQVCFLDRKQKKVLESHKETVKKYGSECAKKIFLRLSELLAAPALKDMPPQARVHPHKGSRQGWYSLDLKHPYRLIVEPTGKDFDPCDPATITEVKVIEITDPH